MVFGLALLRETYTVILLELKAKKIRQETGDLNNISALHDGASPAEHFRRAIIRPFKLFLFSPIVLLLSLLTAVVFGELYVFITTFPTVFIDQYHFSNGTSGLVYLGLGVGFFIGMVLTGSMSDRIYRKLKARNSDVAKPEFRLPLMFLTSPLMCVGFFWYGWSIHADTHWIVPIIGTTVFGIGMMPTMVRFPLL